MKSISFDMYTWSDYVYYEAAAICFKGPSKYAARAMDFCLSSPRPTFSFAYKHNNILAT